MQGLETESASIGQSPRRFEVITGEAGRRSHPDAFKGRLVALTLEPGACIADIARAHGIHPQLLYTWRRQAKTGKLALPAAETAEFVPLVIEDGEEELETQRGSVSPLAAPQPPSEPAAVVIEIGGVTVRLPGNVDATRIAAIAAALRETL